MSRRESISRCNLIIKKLRRAPATFKEISDYLELESELQDYNFTLSTRTFQRDLVEIRSIYNIDIQYDFSGRVYFIESDQQSEVSERIMEAFDTFSALNLAEKLSEYIWLEKRKPQGSENLYGILHSIKNRQIISFTYHKYWGDEVTGRIVKPYALKEFKNRWYLLGNDQKDSLIKCFALDRLSNLFITRNHFQFPDDFNVNDYFKYSFGIIRSDDELPQDIILSFDPFQGKYIKSLPLHESQEILDDNENELLIKLTLYITHDFLMEILSYGENVKVIKPDCLIEELKVSYQNALNLY
jgi:predicted DNA-binding transcriptional regulator YafY